MCMRWTSRCVTSLVNETTNSNVLGPQEGGGHDGSGSGGGTKGGGEEMRTSVLAARTHSRLTIIHARESTQEEPVKRKRKRPKPRARPVMVVLVQRPSVLVTWKDDLRDGTIILWVPAPKRDTCCTC